MRYKHLARDFSLSTREAAERHFSNDVDEAERANHVALAAVVAWLLVMATIVAVTVPNIQSDANRSLTSARK